MTLKTKMRIQISLAVLFALVWVSLPVFATGDGDHNCQGGHNCNGGSDGQAQSESEANATAESTAAASAASYSEGSTSSSSSEGGSASAEGGSASVGDTTAEGGNVGDINISTGNEIPADTTHKADIKIKNTPDIVTITPGSGDSCKAHLGFSVSVPGVGTGMTIPLPGKECRKLTAYDRAVAMEQWQVAEIMFCSLKEVKAEFRSFGLNCVDILTLYIEPSEQITLTTDEYDGLLVAQVQKEEFEEAVEAAEYRYVQQQHLIEELQEKVADHEDDGEKLERLKQEAAALRAAQEAEERKQAEVRAQFKRRLDAHTKKGEEKEPDQ